MQKYTTRKLRGIAYLWMSFPISFLIYASTVLGLDLSGNAKLLISPLYWIISILSFVAGRAIIEIAWFGWYAFVLSNFGILYMTLVVLIHYSVSPIKGLMFSLTLALQSLCFVLVTREIRVPYFFPRVRWWESDPRYKLSLPVQVSKSGAPENITYEAQILDLSLGGCFIKTHTVFAVDDHVNLSFKVLDREVNCAGTVVWKTESTVTYPKGVGVKFDPLARSVASILRKATRRLHQLARLYSQKTREKNWQEYLEREKGYQSRKNK